MSDALREALERTRSGYEDERVWHTFLMDAYTGGGGFQGSVRQPDAGWWGAAASRYAPWSAAFDRRDSQLPDTYLDRFPREDMPKFRSRCDVAHYWNFVGPLTDLKLSYLLRKGFIYHDQPEELADWRHDVDGHGSSWDELRPLVALMAAMWGWTPVLIDMDPASPGMSLAQAEQAGLGRPRAVPLTPGNLVDWDHDGQTWRWVKVRTDHIVQETWAHKPVSVARYSIWTPETVETFEVRGDDRDVVPLTDGPQPHPFGVVPLVIFRHSRCPGDPVRGVPMHSAPAVASKRLFNLLSELDELLRSQTFSVLVLATKGELGNVSLGTDNALPLDAESRQKHYFMAPDSSSATIYEKRIEATVREGIYRPARVEFEHPSGRDASGVARAYSFSQTNRAIADFGGEFARGEREMDGIAWTGLGRDTSALDAYDVRAPSDYDVEDLATEIANVTAGLALKLGTEMETRLRQRIVSHFEPDLPADVQSLIETELRAIAEEDAQARAAVLEMSDSFGDPSPGGDEEDEEDEERPPASS